MRLSAEDAEGEPVVVVVLDPGVEGDDEQPTITAAMQVVMQAIPASRTAAGFLGLILIGRSLGREIAAADRNAESRKRPTYVRAGGALSLGVADGTRTRDSQDHNLVLYQLNYSHQRRRANGTSGPSILAARTLRSRIHLVAAGGPGTQFGRNRGDIAGRGPRW